VKSANLEDRLQVRDIVELVAQVME
jgi:hypothetical protein